MSHSETSLEDFHTNILHHFTTRRSVSISQLPNFFCFNTYIPFRGQHKAPSTLSEVNLCGPKETLYRIFQKNVLYVNCNNIVQRSGKHPRIAKVL